MRKPTIDLTEAEKELLNKIDFRSRNHDEIAKSLEPMELLANSLLDRKAIPEVRLRYLTDPDFHPGGRQKSRLDNYKSNNLSGEDITGHGHFRPYLEYFIYGPNIPESIIDIFVNIPVCNNIITSSDLQEVAPKIRGVIRKLVRQHRFKSNEIAEELFKFSLECGATISAAEYIRKDVMYIK